MDTSHPPRMAGLMKLNERWLMEIGGWQAMKTARSLWQAGAVTEFDYADGLLKGIVRSGGKALACGLRIIGRTDVENLCSCYLARRDGRICEHSIAVGIACIRRNEAKPGSPSSPSASPKPSTPATPAAPPIVSATGPLRFVLNAAFMDGLKRGKLAVSIGQGTGDSSPDTPFLRWLASLKQKAVPPHLVLGADRELQSFLAAIANHPRLSIRSGNSESPISISSEPLRPTLTLSKAPADSASLTLSLPDGAVAAPAATPGAVGWIWLPSAALLAPLQIPPAFAELSSFQPVSKPRAWLASMLGNLQEWFSLDSTASDPDLLRQRLLPAQPEFLLSLEGSLDRIAARLLCRYQGNPATVAPGAPGNSGFPIPSPSQPGVFLTRNAAAEAAAIRRLERSGFTEIIGDERILRGEGPILQFIAGDLERLKSEWSVSFGSRFAAASSKVERVAPDWKPAGSGQDWLAFDLQFVSSGGTVFDRAAIARMLATGTGHQKLPNGRTAVISLDETADFNEVLQDVQPDQHSGHFRVRKSQLDYLAQSFNSPLNISPGDSWPAADSVPPTIFNTLRDYQKSGVQWLLDQASASLGGILADEMGLGKTLQTLALIAALRSRFPDQPCLVVCPKSLLGNWEAEAARFTPDLPVLRLHGPNRADLFPRIPSAAIVLTSFQLLARDAASYPPTSWAAAILDEAGFIRNPDTLAAKAAHRLNARVRIALTGTPVENSVRDLWSILQFARPGYLGPRNDFKERYELPLAAGNAAKVIDRLRRRLTPCLLRRLKQDVARDLPSKIESIVRCDLTPTQRDLYAGLLREGASKVIDAENSRQKGQARLHMLTALLRLRQTCCDPRLLPGFSPPKPAASDDPDPVSGKLEALAELLDEIRDGGHSVLIFSAFSSMLDLIEATVAAANMAWCRIDGKTADRTAQVDAFQRDPEKRVFLISLKAGGFGLNLTKADTVIHFDPWWNPAVEAQATDRAHRIGQSRPVTIYKLISSGTVEEKILLLQQKKRGLMEATLDDDAPVMDGLSDDDLRSLLSPASL